MQKIVFVGIILIIGLFSLQYSISTLYTDQFSPNKSPAIPTLVPVNLITPECHVIYVYPADTVIEIVLPEECTVL
jgi:hypothetical protein